MRSISGESAARSGYPTRSRFWAYSNTSGASAGAAALGLIVWRYLQDRTSQALIEGCAIATLAFFALATRMHERYLFNGLLFTIACIPFARRYFWGAIALSVVLLANLIYSSAISFTSSPETSLEPTRRTLGRRDGSIFVLGRRHVLLAGLSVLRDGRRRAPRSAAARESAARSASRRERRRRRAHWFDPREGLAAMRVPLDYAIAGALGVCQLRSLLHRILVASRKVFDEIYFARAGEEYLQNFRIYENTHPPLSKLLITLSIVLFGGMPKGHGLGGWTALNGIIGHLGNGDNSYGWRFLDVVFGALVVMLLYAFAKRVTGSTVFATIAALLLTFDGMHFVQSRIATPEGFVVFFATLAVYAFYRFWISSQVGERAHVVVPGSGRCSRGPAFRC